MDKIKLTNRIFFRQTRNTILIALVLGIIVSIAQILTDFRAEQKRIDETVLQVLNTTRDSAAQAAYSLNNELALRVVKGLFEYEPIYSAQVIDDFGRQLATLERPPLDHNLIWLATLIPNGRNEYSVTLYLNDTQTVIGEIRVLVDRLLIAENFLERSTIVIITGIARNFILAIFFGLLFYYSLGKPVMDTINNVAKINPNEPAKTRLEIPEGHHDDELGLLIRKFNTILLDFDDTLQQRFMAEDELRKNENTIRQLNQRLEERVRQRTNELEIANKEMEAFTYSVSHDLRAPLRTIGGFSNILQEEYSDQLDDQAKHYLNRVRIGTEKMEALINDLLKLSRSTRGDIHRAEFDLSELVEEVVLDIRNREEERDIQIEIEPNIHVFADRRFMKVVIENLVSNAWKYTKNTEKPLITFGTEGRGQDRTYYLKDNGIGFDMKYADKLFTPFQRLHSARDFEGTGVGLATVQRVISRHNGEIWADAKPNEGAIFYFTLRQAVHAPSPTITETP